MTLPRYPAYKDSGVDWLGEVPEHWEVTPLKRMLSRNDSGVWGDEPESEYDPIVLRSTEQGVGGEWQIIDPARRKLSKTDVEKSTLCQGDLLVTKSSGSEAHIGKASLVTPEVAALRPCYSNFMQRLRVTVGHSSSFVNFILNNRIAREQMAFLSSSTTGLANLNATVIGQVQVAAPPLGEQTAVATFLDHETSKIDALIAEQKNLIALLKEKRQAVISHAVTKGLNPDVPMKDSGVEWLEALPANWSVGKIKNFCLLITDGAHVSPETENGVFEFVSTKDLDGDTIDFAGALMTSEESYESLVKSGCRPFIGDVLFSKDGTIGRTVVVYDERPFVVASSLIIIRPDPDRLSSSYLNYLCQSSFFSQQVDRFVKGAGLPRLSIQNLRKVIGIIPPMRVQEEIVTHLDFELTLVGALIDEAEDAIDLLRERRSALISAAVTGKIDVRNLVRREAA